MTIDIKHKILSEKLFLKLQKYFNKIISNDIFDFTNKDRWDYNVKGESNLIKIHNLYIHNSELYDQIYYELRNYFSDFSKDKVNFNLYVWTPGSYINWHNDGDYKYGFTLYMNDNWNENNGGIFLYKDHKDNYNVNGYIPQSNSLVKVKNNFHSVTSITPNSPLRLTIQGFVSL